MRNEFHPKKVQEVRPAKVLKNTYVKVYEETRNDLESLNALEKKKKVEPVIFDDKTLEVDNA